MNPEYTFSGQYLQKIDLFFSYEIEQITFRLITIANKVTIKNSDNIIHDENSDILNYCFSSSFRCFLKNKRTDSVRSYFSTSSRGTHLVSVTSLVGFKAPSFG